MRALKSAIERARGWAIELAKDRYVANHGSLHSPSNPLVIPSNTLVIPRRGGWSRFWQFPKLFFIARAPSRIRTNPETRVGSFRFRKNLELELRPNSFRKIKKSTFKRVPQFGFPTHHFCFRFKSLLFDVREAFLTRFEEYHSLLLWGCPCQGLFSWKNTNSRFSSFLMDKQTNETSKQTNRRTKQNK